LDSMIWDKFDTYREGKIEETKKKKKKLFIVGYG
jgi:hypothetical protein